MVRVGLILRIAAVGLLLACGGGSDDPPAPPPVDDAGTAPAELNCVNRADDDSDGLVDCDDPDCDSDNACRPVPPKPCARQRDCGDIVNEISTKCCLTKPPESDEAPGALRCFAPGPADRQGKALETAVTLSLILDAFATSSTKPQSALVRFIFPEKIDGTPLSCADILALSGNGTQAERNVLDDNAELNQVLRALYSLSWGGSSSEFARIPIVPQGNRFILYGEIWYGARDNQNPTGNRIARYCKEGVSIGADSGQSMSLRFTPGT